MGCALPEACRPHARYQVIRLRLWSSSTTRVRSQLFWSYASSTGPVGPTRVVVGFRRGGRDLFCSALCLRVRLTRVVRLCVARVSPGARRPDACRSISWLRFWSPSTTRVRSQLFLWYASSTGPVGPTRVVVGFRRGGRDLFCSALCLRVRLTRVVRLCVARVSPGARRPDACRSIGWLRFWSPSTTRVRSQLFLWYASSTGPVGPTRVVVGFRKGGRDLFCSALCLRVRLTRVIRLCVARVSPRARRPDACRSISWLRFWSPSTTRVRSQLFLWYASSTGPVGPTRVVVGFRRGGRDLFCSALCLRVRLTRVVRLCVARVSPGARRPDACRSMV